MLWRVVKGRWGKASVGRVKGEFCGVWEICGIVGSAGVVGVKMGLENWENCACALPVLWNTHPVFLLFHAINTYISITCVHF